MADENNDDHDDGQLELPRWTAEAVGPAASPAYHVRHGHPNTVIDRLIRRLEIDLVALAAHGKSELEKTLLGSDLFGSSRFDLIRLERPQQSTEALVAQDIIDRTQFGLLPRKAC